MQWITYGNVHPWEQGLNAVALYLLRLQPDSVHPFPLPGPLELNFALPENSLTGVKLDFGGLFCGRAALHENDWTKILCCCRAFISSSKYMGEHLICFSLAAIFYSFLSYAAC